MKSALTRFTHGGSAFGAIAPLRAEPAAGAAAAGRRAGRAWALRQGRAGVAVLMLRATFLILLAAAPLVPEPRASLLIFPEAADFWGLFVFAGLLLLGLVDHWIRRRVLLLDLVVLAAPVFALGYAPYPWDWLLLYPALAYLAVRMVLTARTGHDHADGSAATARDAATFPTVLPRSWLVFGAVVLAVVHVTWTLGTTTVTDTAYAGVYGALKIDEGRTLYNTEPGMTKRLGTEAHYDTYGPFNYYAYLPFTLIAGVKSESRRIIPFALYRPFASVPKAKLAGRLTAAFFDLLTAALLFWLGLQVLSWGAGVTLAFAWLAAPIVLYTDVYAYNDTILTAMLAGTLLAARLPARRGMMTALAAWTKLSPLALVPLLAAHKLDAKATDRRNMWRLARFAAGFLATTTIVFVPVLIHNDPGTFFVRTFQFQASRNAGDSLWAVFDEGFFGTAEAIRDAGVIIHGILVACAAVFALALFRARRRRDVVGVAAASAAVLIAIEICQGFYGMDYLLWFLPLVLAALLLDPHSTTRRVVSAGLDAVPRHASSRERLHSSHLAGAPISRAESH